MLGHDWNAMESREMMPKRRVAILCVGLGAGLAVLAFSGAVRRAAANAPPDRYQIASGEVLDTQTGLVWQQLSSSSPMSWSGAQTYCAPAWRLPTMKELQTLVDEAETDPAIDTSAFPDVSSTSGSDYWSSSPVAGLSSYAWYVRFEYGVPDYGDVTYQYRVRCVR